MGEIMSRTTGATALAIRNIPWRPDVSSFFKAEFREVGA